MDREQVAERLNEQLAACGQAALEASMAGRFADYLALLLRWNARTNLTAIRDEEGILSRHFVESIACARALPAGIGTLLDFGSGAGFPGLPIALCRSEIAVTLAESQGKKAAFLNEAVRVLGLTASVFAGRAETLPVEFDCVTLRAVDRMELALRSGGQLVRAGGYLAAMTSQVEFEVIKSAAGGSFVWRAPMALPGSETALLALAQKGGGEF